MRVAILAWDLPPNGSGLGRAAMEIAGGLSRIGCDVTVFDSGRAFGDMVCENGLLSIGCAPPTGGIAGFVRKRAMIGHLVAPWYFRKAVRDAHRINPFDIIEATNWYAPAAFLTSGAPPLVVRNSTPAIDAKAADHGLRQSVDLWFAHQLEKRTAKRADALISNTSSHRRVIENVYQISEHPIHQVISLALDGDVLTRGAAAPMPSPVGPPSLLFVGRAERRKGFSDMLAGFARANRVGQQAGCAPIQLTTVGVTQADVMSNLRARDEAVDLCDQIRVLNDLSDDQLYTEYENTTAVIAPSRYESFGLVYREAAAFGRPLIACSEDPAACDFVNAANCGVLAKACTPAALSDAITRLFGSSERWKQYASAGRQHVQCLTVEGLAIETLDVYKKAINSEALQVNCQN